MIPRFPLAACLLLPLLFACGDAGDGPGAVPGEEAAGPQGTLVIVGGALSSENQAVYQAMVTAREGEGPFCIFPTASGDPQGSLERATETFATYLAPEAPEGIFLTVDNPEAAADSAVVDAIRGCSGFFFVGGQQGRIVQVFRPGGVDSPALEALRDRFAEGAVIGGSSAGAAMMTDPMIGGGQSVGALTHGVRAGEDGEGVILETGLGLLDGVQVDQHFIARGRWGRLVTALLATPDDSLAFGIDENTALRVMGDEAQVLGASGVVFLDGREAGPEDGGHGGYGIRMYLLGEGDRVSLSTGEVRRDPTKVPFTPAGELLELTGDQDLFARGVLDDVLAAFALAADMRMTFAQDGLMVELRKGPGFEARDFPPQGDRPDPEAEVEEVPNHGLFLGPFVLSIWGERPEGQG